MVKVDNLDNQKTCKEVKFGSEDSIFCKQSVFTVFCTEDKRQGYFTQIKIGTTRFHK